MRGKTGVVNINNTDTTRGRGVYVCGCFILNLEEVEQEIWSDLERCQDPVTV